jgi:hypothetical protein
MSNLSWKSRAVIALAASTWLSCSSRFDNCEETRTCPTKPRREAGLDDARGEANAGGTKADPGTGGTATSAGSGGIVRSDGGTRSSGGSGGTTPGAGQVDDAGSGGAIAEGGTGGRASTTDAGFDRNCGNGLIEPGETCDGNCATSCSDGVACTADVMTGSAATCDVACTHPALHPSGANLDGCCPPGVSNADDKDCKSVCGNSVIESGEMCDGPDTWHCSPQCQSRRVYTTCNLADTNPCGTDNLTNVVCDQGVCAPVSPNYALNGCPQIAGNFTQGIYYAQFCAISCNTAADCPPELKTCFDNPFKAADSREVLKYCTR